MVSKMTYEPSNLGQTDLVSRLLLEFISTCVIVSMCSGHRWHLSCLRGHWAVASLGWATPGAATEGVTPLFFLKKPGDLSLVASCTRSSLVLLLSSSENLATLFLLIAVTMTIAFYCFHSGVTPSRVSPHTFFTCPISFLHYSL